VKSAVEARQECGAELQRATRRLAPCGELGHDPESPARTMAHLRSLVVLTLASFAAFGCSEPIVDTPIEPQRVEAAGNPFAPTPRETYYEPDENGARVSGRIDTALLPAGTRVHARLAETEKKSRGAHLTCEDGAFVFEDVPPGDWYVIVAAWSPGASWWWSTNVTQLTRGESCDFGTLALLPTQVTVRMRIDRAPSAGPRPDGTTAADARHRVILHANGDGMGPFVASVELGGESAENVFHGAPPALCAVAVWSKAPLTPRQRLVDGQQQTRVDLADGPAVVEIVSTIESGPLTRPHVRFPVPIELVQLGSPSAYDSIWCSDGQGARQARFDTLETQGYAYAELAVGTAYYTVALEFGRGAKRLFFHGSIEVPEGLNIGYDAEATPAVAVQLVVPAELEGDDASLRLYSPTEQRFGIQYDSGASKITADEPSGERRIAIAELPVGWAVRIDDKAPFEWLIPAEGGVVHPRPVQ
jgi:hypothetical protein